MVAARVALVVDHNDALLVLLDELALDKQQVLLHSFNWFDLNYRDHNQDDESNDNGASQLD